MRRITNLILFYLVLVSRYHSYLNSATAILNHYDGTEPFASFIRKYFATNKKYGSKDRKHISHLCYCFFRLGKMATTLPTGQRILLGLFLSSDKQNELLEALRPEWNEKVMLGIDEKFSMLNEQYSISQVFPWKEELSQGIDNQKFSESFFIQPDLFLRLRPGKEELVKQKLEKAGITFNVVSNSCLSLSNSSKIDEVIALNKEAVVQDQSSQRVREFLVDLKLKTSNQQLSLWDCCAASGGKSIMAKDIVGDIDLTVSDVRESILANLKKRFNEAGITKYKSFVADLTHSSLTIDHSPFSFIIADVPCTGSGTWSRTPEQLYYFEQKEIEVYSDLQKSILSNVIKHLQSGGYLLYITCSVFKKENEEVVDFLKQNFHFEVTKMEVLKGYDKKADTMFAALLQRPL